jgi:hypothetical protein
MKRTWKTVTAGIVGLVVGIPVIFLYPVYLLITSLSGQSVNAAALLILLIGLPAIIGGILALRRKIWWLTLVAMILSIPAGHLSFLGLSAVLDWVLQPADIEMLIAIIPFIGSVIVTAAAVLIGQSRREFQRSRPVSGA